MSSGRLETEGAVRHTAVLSAEQLERLRCRFPEEIVGGVRVGQHGLRDVSNLLDASGPIGRLAADVLGADARPVRALLFDKTVVKNWSLAWHQDRTICVREKKPSAEFATWSVKSGLTHVEPPFEIIQRMLTVRVHLDRVDEANAPLRIIPRSQQLGRLNEAAIAKLATTQDSIVCLAEPGDVWVYRTAIVHASAAKTSPGRRRVLQLDYAACELPHGLAWVALT